MSNKASSQPAPMAVLPRPATESEPLPPSIRVLRKGDQSVESFLERAASQCADQGGKLTDLRRTVLTVLWQADQPIGAYEVIRRLNALEGRKIGPPTIYRALEFLLQAGLAARVQSRNAYTACSHPEQDHACIFLLCRTCGTTTEFVDPDLEARLMQDVAQLGYLPERRFLEVVGLCPACRSDLPAPAAAPVCRIGT